MDLPVSEHPLNEKHSIDNKLILSVLFSFFVLTLFISIPLGLIYLPGVMASGSLRDKLLMSSALLGGIVILVYMVVLAVLFMPTSLMNYILLPVTRMGFRMIGQSLVPAGDPKLNGIIEEVISRSGIKTIRRVYIRESSEPNASCNSKYYLILNRGLFDVFNEGEIKSIIAHELGHIYHNHMGNKNTILSMHHGIFTIIHSAAGRILPGKLMTKLFGRSLDIQLELISILHSAEYSADNFAISLGYGEHTLSTQIKYSEMSGCREGVDSVSYGSHPLHRDRIENIRGILDVLSRYI